MDVLECIKTRRSIRKFLDVPVEWEKVTQIVDAARCAPSAGNLQNWKFIVVLNEDKRKSIAEACVHQLWMGKAPVHIIVCAEPERAKRFYGIRGERLYTIQNCGAAIENALLTAHSIGLAACWVGAFDEDMVKMMVQAKKTGLKLDGPYPALLIQGDDELGALAEVHSKLYQASVNIYASTGVTDSKGNYGYLVYVRPEDHNRAAKALGI